MAHFDVDYAESLLSTQKIGRKIIYQAVTGTTMDDALEGAQKHGHPHGTAYIAELQMKARGSKGRHWNAKNNGNIYMSLIIHMDVLQDDSGAMLKQQEYDLDVCGALATLCALEEEKIDGVCIKWLNDIWVRGHKLCGALAEHRGQIHDGFQQKQLFILGIGLNVNCDIRRDSMMFGLATSTFCETGRELCREKLYSRICYHLERLLSTDRAKLLDLYREKQIFKVGEIYRATAYNSEANAVHCKFLGIQDDWSVQLEAGNGEIIHSTWNVMSLRPRPPKSIYILAGSYVESWSFQLLTNTFKGLVHTMKLDVKSLELTGTGVPEDCAMIAIGELHQAPDAAAIDQIMTYVNNGGACLCTGNSCQLFGMATNGDSSQTLEDKITAVPVCISVRDREPVNIMLSYTGTKLGLESCKDPVLLGRRVDLKNGDGTQSMETGSMQNGCDGQIQPDIVVTSLGSGKVCLSAVNLEVTYSDVEEFFPTLAPWGQDMQNGIYYRDHMIMQIMDEVLGL